jgi:tRNA(adenine34) deaminase
VQLENPRNPVALINHLSGHRGLSIAILDPLYPCHPRHPWLNFFLATQLNLPIPQQDPVIVILTPFSGPANPLSLHEPWMRLALEEARQAFDEAEVPIGAIIVHQDRVIAAAHNQREMLKDPTAHAEMIAITQAAEALGSWRLLDCTLYVTLEPCPMCAGAIVQARIPTVVYGTTDPKAGACHTLYQITEDSRLNHRSTVLGGVLATECRQILQEFFAVQRSLGKK